MSASPLLSRSRVLSRSLSLSLKPSSKKPSPPSQIPNPISNSRSQLSRSERRISLNSRLPLVSSCLLSMLPLHSAIASARLTSVLSAESQSWGWIPQDGYPTSAPVWIGVWLQLNLIYSFFGEVYSEDEEKDIKAHQISNHCSDTMFLFSNT